MKLLANENQSDVVTTSGSEDSGAQDGSFSPTVKHFVIMNKNVFTFKTEEKLVAVIYHFKPSWM